MFYTGGMVRWLKRSSKETITRHFFISKILRWLKIGIIFVSNSICLMVTKINDSNFESSQNQMHMLARVIVSFENFLSHLTLPPVIESAYISLHMMILFHLTFVIIGYPLDCALGQPIKECNFENQPEQLT